MQLQSVEYEVGGNVFTGFLADGSDGSHPSPGVLVIHEGGGLTDHTKQRAVRLAEVGYVAFAMDLFGGTGPTPSPDQPEALARARAIVNELRADVSELRKRGAAGLAVLQRHARVDAKRLAAIGYCFGGAAAIELARAGAPLAAVVGFHAGILPGTAEDNRAIRAKILLCHGADDPIVPAAQICDFAGDLNAAGIDWQLHLYGCVGHSFTNLEIDAWGITGFFHHPDADRRSWAALLALLGETLNGPA